MAEYLKSSSALGAGSPMYCDICKEDREVPSDAYCTVCNQHLCRSCRFVHERVNASKSHRVYTGDALANETEPYYRYIECGSTTDKRTECPWHSGTEVEYFCQSHDAICCGKCRMIEHRNCTLQSISEAAVKLEIDAANRATLREATDMLHNVKALIQENESDLESFKEQTSTIVETIKSQRKKIDERLDKWEQHLTQIVKKFSKDRKKQIDNHNSILSEIANVTAGKVTKLDSAIKSLEGEAVAVASDTRKDVRKYQATLADIERERVIVKMKLSVKDPSGKLSECLNNTANLTVTKEVKGDSPERFFMQFH